MFMGKKNSGIKSLRNLNIEKNNRNPIMVFRSVFKIVWKYHSTHIAFPPNIG